MTPEPAPRGASWAPPPKLKRRMMGSPLNGFSTALPSVWTVTIAPSTLAAASATTESPTPRCMDGVVVREARTACLEALLPR